MKPGIQIIKAIFEGLIKVIPMIRNRRKQGAIAIPDAPESSAATMRAEAAEASVRHTKSGPTDGPSDGPDGGPIDGPDGGVSGRS